MTESERENAEMCMYKHEKMMNESESEKEEKTMNK